MKLPVSPDELRRRFPSLTDEDLEAWTEVTRRLLAEPSRRGPRLAGILAAARRGEDKAASGGEIDAEERLALRYSRALGKMQGSGRSGGPE